MPHQLRRIIAINIRNPIVGLPSGRIAELDPRGGVLAVGDNGVGKTTFLRLLPIFYGATPTQVLKGTGRSSMISYTLPDPSSAVAYEYERESDTDLRTVVMHARAGEEAPQFHIIHGGYQETFFYDENNQYVGRDEFKARVEAMGVEVTRRLTLHQYRAVILNERLSTKEGVELRRLAALHSLGPRALYNLDQISAAMANEKINFRDLQNIVLERVSDAHTVGVKPTNVRELKQNKESVSRWIEARAHLADILKRRPDAQRIRERVATIKGLHLELSSLHVAVKSALTQAKTEHGQLLAQQLEQTNLFNKEAETIQASILELKNTKDKADATFHTKRSLVESALERQAHFERIGVQDMASLEESEADLKAQKVSREGERETLTKAAGDITSKWDQRKTDIEQGAASQVADIDARSQQSLRTSMLSLKSLNQAQEDALRAMATPVRLAEIVTERVVIGTAEGEIKQKLLNPMASAQTRADLKAAEVEANRWLDELTQAQGEVTRTREAHDHARSATDSALSQVQLLEKEYLNLGEQIEQLQASLTPEAGTLLEFIRSGDPDMWVNTAKVLDPALLVRTDLYPTLAPDALDGISQEGSITVGAVSIRVQELDAPVWFDMQEVREAIERKQAQAGQVAEALKQKIEAAKKLGSQAKQAETSYEGAKAHQSLTQNALNSARQKKGRLDKVVLEEERAFKDDATAAHTALQDRSRSLDAEEQRITQGLEATRQAVRDDFKSQRDRQEQADVESESRFNAEKQAVQERKDADLARLQDDYERSLAGMGLDSRRVSDLDAAIQKLGTKLDSIALNRHEVSAWRMFCLKQLPSLESDKLERDRAEQRAKDVGKQLQDERERAEALTDHAKKTVEDIKRSAEARAREAQRLEDILTHGLKDFLDHVSAHLHVDWSVPDLESSIKSRRSMLESESEELQKDSRSLRNELIKHTGGPADWLEHKERDLPDRQILLPHQYLCAQAEVLCDWFEPMESGPYINQLNKEMQGFFSLAGEFVRVLDMFERRVQTFNNDLSKALAATKRFERFRNLSVTVSSSVSQLDYIKVLRQMQDKGNRNPMAYRSVMRTEQDLPSDEDAILVRGFRDILQNDGGFKINLNEQVKLEFTLYENSQRRTISNEEEFRSVSSNGNSALITAMFLMGFLQMVRGDSPVRITWISDEIGRFDARNLGAFLQTLDQHKIDVISACPSIDPALARFFPRLCIFEANGAIYSTEQQFIGAAHGQD
jgi:hypothetical protein